jgi:hypothetical protein
MNYYEGNILRDIAISGANMGASYIYVNKPLMNSNPWWNGWPSPIKAERRDIHGDDGHG